MAEQAPTDNPGNLPASPGIDCPPPPAPCNPPDDHEHTFRWQLIPDALAHETVSTASRKGTGFMFVNPLVTFYEIELAAPTHQATFSPTRTITSDIGFWKGDVDDTEQYVLLINGMENWYGQDKAASKLHMYTIDGELLWTYDMGFEGWGADLSPDGQYAAYTTSNPTQTFGVLNANDGTPVWTNQSADYTISLTTPSSLGGIDSKEVKISNTNKYLAIGHGGGEVLLADLLTGELIWHTTVYGQVRGILFSPDDTYMYVGSGDGNAYKINTSDGSIVWQADIGSWPFTNGFKLSPDGQFLGSAGKTGEVTIIDTENGKHLWQFDQQGNASWLDFSPDGQYVFAGGGGQYANTLYEVLSGKRVWKLDGYSHQGRFSADGSYILIGDKNITLVDLSGNQIGTYSVQETADQQVGSGQFAYITNDGKKVVYTRRDIAAGAVSAIFASSSVTNLASGQGDLHDDVAIGNDNTLVYIALGGITMVIFAAITIWTAKKSHKSPEPFNPNTAQTSTSEENKETSSKWLKSKQKKSPTTKKTPVRTKKKATEA
jgi:outer membrane protein assembly factor BamB